MATWTFTQQVNSENYGRLKTVTARMVPETEKQLVPGMAGCCSRTAGAENGC